MKKEKNKNFTKLTHKKGISLIVLIVTIIVIIILAAVVILTISKNNPIESAEEAKFKEDIRSFQDDLALTISEDYTAKSGQRDKKFNATKLAEIQTYIPSFTIEYEGKVVIKNDELMYIDRNVNESEEKWLIDLGIKLRPIDAQTVAEGPIEYYGQYITNYITGTNEIDNNTQWKIFHSDGNNIYLITADYVKNSTLPKAKRINSDGTVTEYTINKNGEYKVYFTNVINAYNGSSDIKDPRIQALNSDYFSKGYTSTYYNM